MKTENLMITIEDYQKDNPNDKREDYEIAKELINNFFKSLKIDSCISEPRGVVKDNWEFIKYICDYEVNNKNLTYEYFLGIGHIDWTEPLLATDYGYKDLNKKSNYKNKNKYLNEFHYNDLVIINAVRLHKTFKEGEKQKVANIAAKLANIQKVYPNTAEVFACICSEGYDALNNTFTNWCNNFGYSDDSIKAKEIYDLCLQRGIEIRNLIGEKAIEYLTDLFHSL